eukprot:TRINITY_DN8767_c0_g1_i1.p1 TRINITY_DN8767_c0_g1~~TRINITY_DN8767_c0_g1_i1.p1  ORF type:complete len:2587 (-),score=526.56 TRINITY_DN8767_c0_g1_i1:159-7616(-)
MVLSNFPLRSRDIPRDGEEYAVYRVLLDGLLRALQLSAPSARLLGALHGTLRETNHREEVKLRQFLKRWVAQLAGAGVRTGVALLEELVRTLFDENKDDRIEGNIRFILMEKVALPLMYDLLSSQDGCVEVWTRLWPLLLQNADSKILAEGRVSDVDRFSLKVQLLTCVYGAIEILFVRTVPEVLRDHVTPRLPGDQTDPPSRCFILKGIPALKKPEMAHKVSKVLMSRYYVRVYAALSAAICASQQNSPIYRRYLFSAEYWALLVEPWESRRSDLSSLQSDTEFASVARPGYSLAQLVNPVSQRSARARQAGQAGGRDSATLLGANLWGATVAVPATQSSIAGFSSQANALQRAAARRAAGTLSLGPGRQQRALAASIARATQSGTAGEDAGIDGGGLQTTVLDADGVSTRLYAALLGQKPERTGEEEDPTAAVAGSGISAGAGVVWRPELIELDFNLYPDGVSNDAGLAVLLAVLRTADVMVERFGTDTSEGLVWVDDLLNLANPSADFRLRLLVLRVLVLRASVLRRRLYGRDPKIFHFVVDVMLDQRFGADKRFHYLFRDALQCLCVPEFEAEEDRQETAGVPVAFECAHDAERLLQHLQKLAPHNKPYWQRSHAALLRLYVSHFFPQFPAGSIEPNRSQLLQQLNAKSAIATTLQHSALRQLVVFVEFGNVNPFIGLGASDSIQADALGPAGPWLEAFKRCFNSEDGQLTTYASGAVGLLAKRYPERAAEIVDACSEKLINMCANFQTKEKEFERVAECLVQLLTQCPWALCLGSASPSQRRLLQRMLSRLPTAAPGLLHTLLVAFKEMCQDYVSRLRAERLHDPMQVDFGESRANGSDQSLPPRSDQCKQTQVEHCREFMHSMQSGDVWRRGLLGSDSKLQLTTATLVRVAADLMDEPMLLGCLGLMLEAYGSLKARRESKEHVQSFANELFDVCSIVCDLRPDIARGEVEEGVVAFLVQACTSVNDSDLHTKALAFWESSLSADAEPRLAEICAKLHIAQVEPSFIPACLQLLSTLAKRSAEYRRKLVNKPLAECEFKPMHVVPSSWAADPRGQQTVAPAASYSTVLRASLTMSRVSGRHRSQGKMNGTANVGATAASVATTLARDAIPKELVKSARARSSQAQAAAAGAVSARLEPAPRLLRHSDDGGRNWAIDKREREKRNELATLEQKKMNREDAVPAALVRDYRVGEYPDVEVAVGDVFEPLLRLSLSDSSLAEELLLALWSGIAAGGAASGLAGGPSGTLASVASLQHDTANGRRLRQALGGLLERCAGDVGLIHFLHRLILSYGQTSSLELSVYALQRSMGVSMLSGVQALEALLPPPAAPSPAQPVSVPSDLSRAPSGAPDQNSGRQRMLLSVLHEAYTSLGERSLECAAAAQLTSIGAFSCPESVRALDALQEGNVKEAAELLRSVTEQDGIVVPEWELSMASSARLNALEQLMSWQDLKTALRTHPGGTDVEAISNETRTLRSDLGICVMGSPAEAAVQKSEVALNAKLVAARAVTIRSAREAVLLAAHASTSPRHVDDAKRLLLQGYDGFVASWHRIPLLASSARHQQLSSLPLLHNIEKFIDTQRIERRRLSREFDAFNVCEDSMLSCVAAAKSLNDRQSMAIGFMDGAHSCRKLGGLSAANTIMNMCLKTRTANIPEFYQETIKLKLAKGNVPCGDLCTLVQREAARDTWSPQDSFKMTLLHAKVADIGWKRQQLGHDVAWTVFRALRGAAAQQPQVEQGRAFAKLARFADAVLRRDEESDEIDAAQVPLGITARQEFAAALIESVARVLCMGDVEALRPGQPGAKAFRRAHDKLPRVFELLAAFPSCGVAFEQIILRAPAWTLLRWLPQALAFLPKVPALQRPLVMLARRYPQAVVWPLQLASFSNGAAGAGRPGSGAAGGPMGLLWDELWRGSAPIKLAMELTEAIDSLNPAMRFQAEAKKLRVAVQAESLPHAQAQWKVLWTKFINVDSTQVGSARADLARKLYSVIQTACTKYGLALRSPELSPADFAKLSQAKNQQWNEILKAFDSVGRGMTKHERGGKESLESFSPWLTGFDARARWLGSEEEWLEIPGQYSGLSRPDPRSHARIVRFSPQVLVMSSKQKPKRLIILGSDEREHWFLAKGGEDLRLDARVEQLFEAINGLIAGAPTLGLRVRTYAVVALLPDLGMVEWVRPTCTMKSVALEMSRARDMRDVEAHKMRTDWTAKFGVGVQRYENIFNVQRSDIETVFRRCTSALPATATLRAYFARSALSPEALWHTRQRFAASLAASSAASYLLGIGDRHLENFLLCQETMEVVPIDFGYSFGIGALLPVPEIAPFRLTGFLLSVLQPLGGEHGHGVFRDGLIEVFRRCRDDGGLLMDTCDIFLREPLMDWTADAKRRGEEVDFLPKRRIRFVRERLQGTHPAKILMEELKDNQTSWVAKKMKRPDSFLKIVAGEDDNLRLQLYKRDSKLSVIEQADCLIQQATDPNVLGRAWEGWAPEI